MSNLVGFLSTQAAPAANAAFNALATFGSAGCGFGVVTG